MNRNYDDLAAVRAVLKQIWKEYRVYLKKTSSTPQFIEERQWLVDSVLRERKDG